MPNTPISGFASGAPAQAGDEFVIARSGANFKLTNTNISSFVLAGPTTQLGAADVASGAVAQTLQVQSNTGASTTGPNFTIKGSSGTTAGGSIIFQTHNGTAYGNALTIASNSNVTFASGATFNNSIVVSGSSSVVYVGNGGVASGGFRVSGNDATGIVWPASGRMILYNTNNGSEGNITLSAYNSGFGLDEAGNILSARYSSTINSIVLAPTTSLSWAASGNSRTGTPDTVLVRDGQPNTLALKNAGNAQIFRVYSTTASSGSYGIISAGVQPDGSTAQADTLYIGSAGANTAMTKLALVQNGTTRLYVDANGNLNTSGDTAYSFGSGIKTVEINGSTSGFNTAQGGLTFKSKTGSNGANAIYCAGGAMSFYAGSTTFAAMTEYLILSTTGLLQFQGTSSSFPALKRTPSSASLQVRLADDSGDAAFQCGTATSGGTAFNVNGTGGNSIASVTNTTTGTLLQVLNSTSNPLMTVTDTTSGTLFSVQSTLAATLFSVNDTTSGTLLAVTNSSSTDVFTVSDAGVVSVPVGSAVAPSINFGTAGTGYYGVSSSQLGVSISGALVTRFNATNVWHSVDTGEFILGSSADVRLARDNAAELALRNGNNGQIFRVYGRYTDGSNYERFFINAPTTSAAAVQIGTQKAGSGTARALELQTDGTTALTLTTAQKAEFAASIKTAAPTTGTAAEWKLGSRVAATTTLDTTQYIELDVGGTLYKLAVVTS